MANNVASENENIEISKSSFRRRVVLYCVIVYVILVISVPLCIRYLPILLDNRPCPIHMSVPLEKPKFHPNGSVEDSDYFYYKNHLFQIGNITHACRCQSKPCIRKCCAHDEYLIGKPSKCQKNPNPSPFHNFSKPIYHSQEKLADVPKNHFEVLFGNVCKYKYRLDIKTDVHLLMSNGHIFYKGNSLDTSKYCMESKNGSNVIETYVCFETDKESYFMFIIYPVFMLSAACFLLATLFVYSIIPDLRNLHGKTLMCFVVSLFATDIGLSIIHIEGKNMKNMQFLCKMLAFTVQFTFLASFFWMNVMCFDIWWVFSGLRAPRGSAKERDHKKFVMYSVYAWGVPALILAISLVMDLASFIPDNLIKPGFGEIKCWFKDAAGTVLYFYLPIATVVLLNTAMFLSTACKLRAHSKETKVLKSSESRQSSRADQDRFDVYLKLFVVMGINWVMELVSFFAGGPKSLWFVTDIGNTLQGVLIFLIFVCKRRVIRLVKQKLLPRWATSSSSAPSQTGSSRTNSTLVSKTV